MNKEILPFTIRKAIKELDMQEDDIMDNKETGDKEIKIMKKLYVVAEYEEACSQEGCDKSMNCCGGGIDKDLFCLRAKRRFKENEKKDKKMKKMCVVVEYDEEVLVQKDVIDLLLESSGGLYRIESHILLSPSNDRHKDALFRLDSFCNWIMKECTTQHDSPFYVDEYLHAKVDKWYTRGNK